MDVIARRAQGPTRGQILLNGVPMSMRLFQDSCAYVTRKCHLLEDLTTKQTLYFAAHLTIGSKVSNYVKSNRVKQVMADLALAHVANRDVRDLNQSEYRRLVIGKSFSSTATPDTFSLSIAKFPKRKEVVFTDFKWRHRILRMQISQKLTCTI